MATKRITEDMGFITDTVSRSMPNLHRPRLKTESEHRLAELEQRSAQAYAAIEAVTERAKLTAQELAAPEGVPVPVDVWDDTSMVHHVEEIRGHVTIDIDLETTPELGEDQDPEKPHG